MRRAACAAPYPIARSQPNRRAHTRRQPAGDWRIERTGCSQSNTSHQPADHAHAQGHRRLAAFDAYGDIHSARANSFPIAIRNAHAFGHAANRRVHTDARSTTCGHFASLASACRHPTAAGDARAFVNACADHFTDPCYSLGERPEPRAGCRRDRVRSPTRQWQADGG